MRDITNFTNQYHTTVNSGDQNPGASQDDEPAAHEESVWPESLLIEYAKRFFD